MRSDMLRNGGKSLSTGSYSVVGQTFSTRFVDCTKVNLFMMLTDRVDQSQIPLKVMTSRAEWDEFMLKYRPHHRVRVEKGQVYLDYAYEINLHKFEHQSVPQYDLATIRQEHDNFDADSIMSNLNILKHYLEII